MSTSGAPHLLDCTQVTPQCPVSATSLSYRPSLAGNAFLLAIFALCALLQLVFGIRYRTWTYMLALVLGSITEIIGYVGRIMLSDNPWSTTGFEIQIICLIIAPVFIAAGIYLTLKHFVLEFGEQYSVLKPAKLYTWIFISADIFSLIVQGAGAALAAGGKNPSTAQTGSNLALAGIVFQVFSLLVFGVLFTLYFFRLYRSRQEMSPLARRVFDSTQFRCFFWAVILAFITVLIRCTYRIPELAGRWRNAVFRNEVDFMVLDGAMMAIAVLALTIAHPGFCFGGLSRSGKKSGNDDLRTKEGRSSDSLQAVEAQ